MNTVEILNVLKNSGFMTKMTNDMRVVVSLKRNINYGEVEAALDYKVSRGRMNKMTPNKIIIK